MALETDLVKEFESFKKICLELKEKSERNETRCLMLETEVDNMRKKNQELEVKIATIQKVIDDDNILNVIIENKVLESEKQKAESEVLFLKEKVKENEKVKEDVNVVPNGTKHVRKRLFEEDGLPNKKMAPSTPGVAQSTFRPVIDNSDEDVDYNEIPNNLQKTDEEHMDEFKVRSSDTRIAKRKRAANVITSDDDDNDDDDDDSYDDNATLSTLIRQQNSRVMTDSNGENVNRRHLRRLKKVESGNKQDNDVEDESESEDDSSDGFIDDSSESGDGVAEFKDALNEAINETCRKKDLNLKWVLQGDMLSDFGKDTRLCMSAVCALYRQQTADEKESKVTIHRNGRGFNQNDATRGSELAVFLMGRDPEGDLNKTVEELNEYDPKGDEKCRDLALNYSKQLFEIYQNKEDDCFPPAPYK